MKTVGIWPLVCQFFHKKGENTKMIRRVAILCCKRFDAEMSKLSIRDGSVASKAIEARLVSLSYSLLCALSVQPVIVAVHRFFVVCRCQGSPPPWSMVPETAQYMLPPCSLKDHFFSLTVSTGRYITTCNGKRRR